jgi:hypothetical protein
VRHKQVKVCRYGSIWINVLISRSASGATKSNEKVCFVDKDGSKGVGLEEEGEGAGGGADDEKIFHIDGLEESSGLLYTALRSARESMRSRRGRPFPPSDASHRP